MQLIESKTLGSAQASIEFTNIPQTFTDLLLVFSLRSDRSSTNDYVVYSFNGSTSNFSARNLWGYSPSGVLSNTTVTNISSVTAATNTASTFGSGSFYVPNYAGSTNKSFSVDTAYQGTGESGDMISAGLWSQTTAISSIGLAPYLGTNWTSGSSASLYGITKGSDGTTTVS